MAFTIECFKEGATMTIKHAGKEYRLISYTYPRRGNMYYDCACNRVKLAARNIDSRKYIIVQQAGQAQGRNEA
jgi:hypothetical protein